MRQWFVACLLTATILVSNTPWSNRLALAAAGPAPSPTKGGQSVPPPPTPGKEQLSVKPLAFSPSDGQLLTLLGGGGVRLQASFQSPAPVTAIAFSFSADGTTWQPITGAQDTGVKALTGRLAYQRALLWDASALADGVYQVKAVATAGDKTAEQVHKVKVDRASVVPAVKPASDPTPTQGPPGAHGAGASIQSTNAPPKPPGKATHMNAQSTHAPTAQEPIVETHISPTVSQSYLSTGWAQIDYTSAAQITSVDIAFRPQGAAYWQILTFSSDTGLSSTDNGNGTWTSYRYVEFSTAGLPEGAYDLRFTAADAQSHSRVDLTGFQVGPFQQTYTGPGSGTWYGQSLTTLWRESDYFSAAEPQSITFAYRTVGQTAWTPLTTFSSDSQLYKYNYGAYWSSYRYVQWDTTAWTDGAYELQATITDVSARSFSDVVTVYIDRTPPATPAALTVSPAADGVSFDVNWTGNADVVKYELQRAAPAISGAGNWITLGYVTAATTYHDAAVVRGVEYQYRLIAYDRANNSSAPSDAIKVSLPYVAPILDYFNPNGGYQTSNSIYVEAQFRDDLSISQLTFAYSTDNVTWQTMPLSNDLGIQVNGERYARSGYWDVTGLTDGTYHLRVTALDSNSRSTEATASFTLDRQVTISNLKVQRGPDHGLTVSWDPISDASYFYLYAYQDNTYVAGYTVGGSGSSQWHDSAVVEHTYRYRLYAFDLAGNSATAEVTYDYYNGPVVTLTGSNPAYTNQATYLVAGDTEAGATVKVNGTDVTVDAAGHFSSPVSLVEGTNNVTVAATNSTGTHTVNLVINRKSTPPGSFYLTPASNTRVGASFQLYGQAYDASGIVKLSFQFYRPATDTWATAFESTNANPGWYWAYANIDVSKPLSDGQPLGGGNQTWRMQATDAYGNVGTSEQRTLVVDNAGPTAPATLTATPGVRNVALSWSASTSSDITYYRVYRATTAGGPYVEVNRQYSYWYGTTWTDFNVDGSTHYYYVVKGEDDLGNIGPASPEAGAVPTADTTPPTVTSFYPSTGSAIGGPSVFVQAYFTDNDTQMLSAATFEWSGDDGATWHSIPNVNGPYSYYGNTQYAYVYWNTTGLASGTYKIKATATDRSANVGSGTATYTADFFARVPSNFKATAGHGGTVELSWDAVTDPDQYSYRVLRSTTSGSGYAEIGRLYQGVTTFTDHDITQGTTYYYVVQSADLIGNVSAYSTEAVVVGDADTVAPTVTNSSFSPIYANTVGGPSVSFTFFVTDNVQKAPAVTVEYTTDSGATWKSLAVSAPYLYSGLTYYVTGTLNTQGLPEGPLQFKVTPKDAANNSSVWTKDLTLDLSTHAVSNLSAFPGQSSVQLLWTPVADTDFSYYLIMRSTTAGTGYSAVTAVYDRTATGYVDSYQTPGTTNYYVVETHDQYGNIARSAEVSATPQVDTTPPVIKSTDPANDAYIGDSRNVVVYFTENADPRLVTGTMEYSTDGTTWTSVGSLTNASWYQQYLYRNWDISALADGAYQVRYTIKDGANLTDQKVVTYHIKKTPPAAVTLSAAGKDVQHIHLSWTASDPDVQSYRIERATAAAGPFGNLTSVNGTTLVYDDTVTSGQTYYYRVTPHDQLRDGAASNVASATAVADSEPPQITYLAPDNGRKPGSFYLQANASDNVGVVAMRLEYSTDGTTWTTISSNTNATSISLTWDNSTAPEGNVQVRAVALDAAGNSSASRADNPVRTYQLDRTAPAAPVITATATDVQHIRLEWTSDSDVQYVHLEWAPAATGPWTNLGDIYLPTKTYTHAVTPGTTYYYRAWAHDGLYQGATSAPLAASAVADTEKPQVTTLTPGDGARPAVFDLQAYATDNLGVTRIALEYSLDGGTTWTELGAANGPSISYTWNTAGLFPTGSTVKVRAVAKDGAGNRSDNSPVRTYVVDNAVPSAPVNLVAVASVTKIAVGWDLPNASEGVTSFRLYRSTDATTYTLYRSSLLATGYEDTDVQQGVTYQYAATALDAAGNESARSQPVSATPLADTVPPAIISVSPGSGTVGANPSVWVSAQDNYQLKSISLSYRPGTSGAWTAIGTQLRSGRYDGASFAWNTAGLADGAYQLRAVAVDQVGNTSPEAIFGLTLDLTPPPAPVVTPTPGGWSVQLDWTASNATDLYGYRIVRQRADGSWQNLGQTGALTATDQPLNPTGTYTYAVEAVDLYGNVARSAAVSATPLRTDPFPPTAYAGPDSTVYVGTSVTFDGTGSQDNDRIATYTWSFPEQPARSGAVVSNVFNVPGTYRVQLKVTDPAGNEGVSIVTVTVRPLPVVGNLTLLVKDKNSGQRIGSASVVVQVPGGDLLHYTSDGNGEVNLVAPPGDYTAHGYKTGFLPNNVGIHVTQGSGGTYELLLEPGEIVTGTLTVQRMTLDQIVSAGVDVTKPENQFVYKFDIHLAFQNQPVAPQTVVVNYQGTPVGGALAPIIIGGPGGGGGGGGGGATFIAYPTVIPSPRPEVEPTIAYLVIPGKASFLKEFFEVQLRLINNAAEQYVIDNAQAQLNLPNGVVLAPTAQPQSLSVDLAQLAGKQEKVVKWVIRGDTEGDYNLSADFSGKLLPFGDAVHGHFTTTKPFHVWGPSAVKLIVEPQQTAEAGAPYHLRLGMKNMTDQTLPGGTLDPAHVYNAAIELLEAGKQNFIYAPNQQLLQMKGDLAPGETFSADFYLVPCITGTLVLNQSYVLRTGGNATFPTDLRPGHAAPYPGLTLGATRSGNQVTLTWAAVSGAAGYRIYTVRPDLTMSVLTDRVADITNPATTSITLTESGGPRSYIVTVVDAGGKESLQHRASDISWCSGAALPVVTVDPGQVTVGKPATVLITANANGFPVTDGTVSVGTYATNVALDANGQASVTFTATAPGPIDVTLYRAGAAAAHTTITAVAATDTEAPITTATVSGTDGLNGWYYSAATVTLTAVDNPGGSGLKEIRYSLDGVNFSVYTLPITVSSEGITTLHYYAVDLAGNVETTKSRTLQIDLHPPVTTASLSGNTLTLAATDTASGVALTTYSFDGGTTWQTYTAAVSLPPSVSTVLYRSTDHAGRPEVPKSLAIGGSSPVVWLAPLDPNTPAQMVAGADLNIQFQWPVGGVPTLDKTVSVRILNAATSQVIASANYGADIQYDLATGRYSQLLKSALYGITPGTQLKIQIYIQHKLRGTVLVNVR